MTITDPNAERRSRRPQTVKHGTPPTEREVEVLNLVSRGCSNATAGRRLYISEDTVKVHLRSLFVRLGAHDRAHAVRLGFELGLLTPDPQETTS